MNKHIISEDDKEKIGEEVQEITRNILPETLVDWLWGKLHEVTSQAVLMTTPSGERDLLIEECAYLTAAIAAAIAIVNMKTGDE